MTKGMLHVAILIWIYGGIGSLVSGQSEYIGVPQPYSIFVNFLIPLPAPRSEFGFYYDLFMWLMDKKEDPYPLWCKDLYQESDPEIQDALIQIGKSQGTSPSKCDDFQQFVECNGLIIQQLSFTSKNREECMTFCEVIGAQCCEWYQRIDGYKFCTASFDCSVQPATSNSNQYGSYCALCTSKTIPSPNVFSIQNAHFTDGIQPKFIGIDDCAVRGAFCNVLSLNIYPRITNVWFLRITLNNTSLTIQPFIASSSMWGTVGITISRSIVDTTLVDSTTLCGYFDVSAWYYTKGYRKECYNATNGHSLRQTNYTLRICNDSATSVTMMEKVGTSGSPTTDVQWSTSSGSTTRRISTILILLVVVFNVVLFYVC